MIKCNVYFAGGYLTQYFYADATRPALLTHTYEHWSSTSTSLHHDDAGALFALERDGRYFYVALDALGSPAVVFNTAGGVVKQMSYDPLGRRTRDSAPDFSFPLAFQCGVQDHITNLVHLG